MIYLLVATHGYDFGDAAMSEADAQEECAKWNRLRPGTWTYEPIEVINAADDELRAEVERLRARVMELELGV